MYSVERLLGSHGAAGAQATVDRPIDHLVVCHDRIEERLKTLERAAGRLEERPREAREALASVFRYFESSGELHTEDEEQSVFPRLEPRLTREERAYVEELERQHRAAAGLYRRVKDIPAPGEDAAAYRNLVGEFCAHYRSHIASENTVLTELARRVLDAGDLAGIAREMRSRRGWLK